MNITRFYYLFVLSLFILPGCITSPGASGNLGYSQARRVVIVGEKVSKDIALYYQRRYDAMVWFTPTQGLMKDSAQVIFKGIGPSQAMRSLINELKSINYSLGRWEIIVPKIGEGYFFATLKDMETGALSQARGNIVLTDSKANKDMENEVARVTNNNFFVTYEFQKY
ncbi:MAG: hypothetical protein HQL12_05620 [Candidatus Omnitrophica bacterium]|nr:hypothetical protein [Candidatus Omnitrophota bacterium]